MARHPIYDADTDVVRDQIRRFVAEEAEPNG
jgi:hypothetical protein